MIATQFQFTALQNLDEFPVLIAIEHRAVFIKSPRSAVIALERKHPNAPFGLSYKRRSDRIIGI